MMHSSVGSLATACVLGALAFGCRAPQTQAERPLGPPSIEGVTDLGSLALPAQGDLASMHSDGLLTPGEWMAVRGRNLVAGSELTLGGRSLPVAGHGQGGSLLARVPRGLSPRTRHRLEVRTPQGSASLDLTIQSHLVVGDTDGKRVRFLPLRPDTEQTLERAPLELGVEEGFLHALRPDGGILYVLQRLGEPGAEGEASSLQGSQIVVVHMGAAKGPKPVATFGVQTPGTPTAMLMVEAHTLAILSERHVTLVDTTQLGQERVLATLALPVPESGQRPIQYDDLVLLKDRRAVVALEVHGNTLCLINLDDLRAPRVEATLPLLEQRKLPYTIDLATDPEDPTSLWVLQGANFRVAQSRGRGVLGKARSKVGGLWNSVLRKGEQAPEPPPVEPDPAELKAHPSRLLRVRVEGTRLQVAETRPLPPDFFPFFVLPEKGDRQLISGVNGHVLRFGKLPLSMEGLQKALTVLADSTQFGRLVRIRKDQEPETVLQGISLFFGMDSLPDGTPVFSLLRPAVRVLPPSIAVDWGIEALGQGYVSLDSLGWGKLIPPYSLGMIEVQ